MHKLIWINPNPELITEQILKELFSFKRASLVSLWLPASGNNYFQSNLFKFCLFGMHQIVFYV